MGKRVSQLMESFVSGQFDQKLRQLYGSERMLPGQRIRYVNALDMFKKMYGNREVDIYSAAGRSEIGGNHTDHQKGKVLAAAISLDAVAVVAKTENNVIHMLSDGYEPMIVDLSDLGKRPAEEGTTTALIRGIANGFQSRGYAIGGFEAYVTSDVLTGSGLSSSAAYEVLIGNIFSGLYNASGLDAIEIAQIGQEAENLYFGKPCGLMDQMACSVGGMIYIDFEDRCTPLVRKLNVDFNTFGHSLCIVDTKGSHADLTEDYGAIPFEMRQVADFFGKKFLRDVPEDDFYGHLAEIRRHVGDRALLRALHWFEENRRVDEQVQALETGKFEDFKMLVRESGDSSYKYLQNVYSLQNTREQGIALALALSERVLKGRGVSRVHGGGFAGTIQAFVPFEMVGTYRKCMEDIFGKGTCHVLQIRLNGGGKIV